MQLLKNLFYTLLIVGGVALVIATAYFLAIFGVAAIALFLVHFLVTEWNKEIKPPPDP